ncbi:MAG: GFA family protein [Pseudomonadota bacterium]
MPHTSIGLGDLPLKARCYCGATEIVASTVPASVSYCHCIDCRRITGAPVAALAAFASDRVAITGPEKSAKVQGTDFGRTFCADCGSPIAFRGDYAPGQVFLHISLFDDAVRLVPTLHSYESRRLPWLHIADATERHETSSRAALNSALEQGRV